MAYAKSLTIESIIAATMVFAAFPHSSALAARQYTFTVIDAPKASTNPGWWGTQAIGINRLGEIAGYYSTNTGAQRGFVREPDGQFHTFAPAQSNVVYVRGISDNGEVVGTIGNGTTQGFLRAADGHIKIITVPGATGDVAVSGINSHGTITGYFVAADGNFGFVMTAAGAFERFAIHGALSTVTSKINGAGEIAGYFLDSGVKMHGFKRDPDGTLTLFDPPDSSFSYTDAMAIDRNGNIAGSYADSAGVQRAYIRHTDGTFSTVDVQSGSGSTWVTDIGSKNGSVGWYRNVAEGVTHGFDRRPTGRVVNIDFPAANLTWIMQKGAHGTLVGTYRDRRNVYHAFLATPVGLTGSRQSSHRPQRY